MTGRCLDLELLRTFVGVADSGGFTRAAARLYRSQSTVSQQVKRLEEQVGRPLLERDGRGATPTEAGEALLGYARRILALDDEARAMLVRGEADEIIRLGVSEDFVSRHLSEVLAAFSRDHPGVRLDVRADLSASLRQDFEAGELDIALLKGERSASGGDLEWCETLYWVGARDSPLPPLDPLPLALFPQGCVFRQQALERLDTAGRNWRIAFVSPSLAGLQAAVAAGMAIAPLGESGLTQDLQVLDHERLDLPALAPVRISLVSRDGGARRARLCEAIALQLAARP